MFSDSHTIANTDTSSNIKCQWRSLINTKSDQNTSPNSNAK